MATKSPPDKHKTNHPKKRRAGQEIKTPRFSKTHLIIFGLVFAAIGGFAIWRTFAINPSPRIIIADETEGCTSSQTCPYRLYNYGSTHHLEWNWDRAHARPTYCDDNLSGGHHEIEYGFDHTFTQTVTWTVTCYTNNAGELDEVSWQLNVRPPQCRDGGDNDGDGYVDLADPGCLGDPNRNSELPFNPPPPPTITLSLTAAPNPILYNTASTLTWSSTHATACAASGAWSGSKPLSGSQSTGQLTSNKTYTLTCSNNLGSPPVAKSVTVAVGQRPPPTVALSANPSSIPYNGYSYLQWNSTYADSCSAAWTPSRATSGTERVGRLTRTTTFSITCSGNGSASASATVTVGAPPAGCPPNCPKPPPPAPPKTVLPPPPAATAELPPPEPVVEEAPSAPKEPACHKPNHLVSLIFGGLAGELISLIKHTCK